MAEQSEIQIHTNAADAPEQSKKVMSLFVFLFQSVVMAVLFPIVTRFSGRDGDALVTVWGLSLLFCSYFYSAVCALSPATRQHKARLLVRLACAAFVALLADAVLPSRAAGTAIIYLDTVWIAAVFGHAVAEHRASSDKAAETAQEAREKLAHELFSAICLALAYSALAIPLSMLVAGCSLEYVGAVTVLVLFLIPATATAITRKHGASDDKVANENPAALSSSSKEALAKLAADTGLILFLALAVSAFGLCPMCIVMATARPPTLLYNPLEVLVAVVPVAFCVCVPPSVIGTLTFLTRDGRGGGTVVVLGMECDAQKFLACLYGPAFFFFTMNFVLVSQVRAVLLLGLAVFVGYCVGIHPCALVRSKPKTLQLPSDEIKKNQQAGGENKQQTEISSDSATKC